MTFTSPFPRLFTVWLALWGGAVAAEPLSKPTDHQLHIQRGQVYADAALLGASGGATPYTFSLDATTLPVGLRVSAQGVLSGITCASDGAYPLGPVTVTDAAGAKEADATLVLTIDAAPAGGCSLALNTPWPKPVAGQPYQASLSARGGTAPYTYMLASGALPAGLTLSANGILSGTPSTPASQSVTVAVRDAAGATGLHTATMLVVSLTVSPPTLAAGTTGVNYGQSVSAAGGAAPYRYAVTAGSLPIGLSLSAGGRLIGTPAAPGKARFTITATDASGVAAARSYTLVVGGGSHAAAGALPHTGLAGMGTTPVPVLPAPAPMAVAPAPLAIAPAPLASTHDTARGTVGRDTTEGSAGVDAALAVSVGGRPDAAADSTVAGLQSAEGEALKRLGAVQMRNVLTRLDGDVDCRPEFQHNFHLNTQWRDARPYGATEGLNPGVSHRPGCTSGLSAWAAGTVDYGRIGASPDAVGSRFSTPGLTAGVDLAPLRGVRSGVALGHGQDSSELGGGSGRVDSRTESVTAYGSWQAPFGVRLNAALGQSRTSLDLQRTVTGDSLNVQGQRRVTQRYAALVGSTRVEIGEWRVSPRVGIERMSAALAAYSENDGAPLALTYDATRLVSNDVHGGLAITRQWRPALWTVEPQVSVDWHQRLQGGVAQPMRYVDDPSNGGFTLTSVEPSTEFAQLGVGVRLQHPVGWSFTLGARSTLDGGLLRGAGYNAAILWPF